MKIIFNEAELRKPCEEVSDILGEGMDIADKLYRTLDKEPGIGLAANQVGINKRVLVTSVPKLDKEENTSTTYRRTFINPIITKKESPFIFTREGCLSFPDKWVETIRFHKVFVTCSLNYDGLELNGLEAVVLQHEVDHLNGITMYDRRKNKYGSNDPCPCESGKKYKKCCLFNLKEIAL